MAEKKPVSRVEVIIISSITWLCLSTVAFFMRGSWQEYYEAEYTCLRAQSEAEAYRLAGYSEGATGAAEALATESRNLADTIVLVDALGIPRKSPQLWKFEEKLKAKIHSR